MVREWYQDNLLRLLFDIAVTDAAPEALSDIDPVGLVQTVADAGLQTLMFYVQCPTGWLYYPSKIGRQHPKLSGRDIVSECVSACREHGLRFVGYYVPNEMGCETVLHPEWRTELMEDEAPAGPRLWGNICFNRPGAWDYCMSIVRESVSRYEMDGVFFDNFWRRHCGCSGCQKRYLDETGKELPLHFIGFPNPHNLRNPERPEVGVYLNQVRHWISDWAMDLRRTVKAVRPNCAVSFQYVGGTLGASHGYDAAMADAADFIGMDSAFLSNQSQHSYNLKCTRAFSRSLPFDSHMSLAEHHSDEMSAKQEGLIKQQVAYILALGGSVTYIDDMCWDGRISERKYQRIGTVNAWTRERFTYLGGDLLADVGLYMSHEATVYRPSHHHWRWEAVRGDADRGSIHSSGNAAFVQAMIRENIPFDLIHRHRLKGLALHKVIYMNNVELLSEEEAGALRAFVQEGGGLVITHRTGMRDEGFKPRENFVLADVMRVDYVSKPDVATTFISVRAEDHIEGFFSGVQGDSPYFDVQGAQCYVSARTGTLPIGRVARPRRAYNEDGWPGPKMRPVKQLVDTDETRQACIHTYAPELVTEYPAVTLSHFGNGRVAYCAASPSYDYIDDIHDLIVSLVNWAAGGRLDRTLESNAPAPVEIIVMEQPERKRTVVHAINWQPNWPGVVAHGVEVAIKAEGRDPIKAHAVEGKCEVNTVKDIDRVRLTFPPIEAWESIAVDWK